MLCLKNKVKWPKPEKSRARAQTGTHVKMIQKEARTPIDCINASAYPSARHLFHDNAKRLKKTKISGEAEKGQAHYTTDYLRNNTTSLLDAGTMHDE